MQPALFTHTSHHKCYTTSKSCHALPRPPAQRARAAAASARHGGLNWNGTACRPAPARCPLAARRVTPATSLCSSLRSRRRQRQRGGGCRSPQRQPGGGDLCSTHARKSASGWHVRAWDGGGRGTSPLSTAFSSPPSLRMKYESTCTPTRGGASKSPWESDPSDP